MCNEDDITILCAFSLQLQFVQQVFGMTENVSLIDRRGSKHFGIIPKSHDSCLWKVGFEQVSWPEYHFTPRETVPASITFNIICAFDVNSFSRLLEIVSEAEAAVQR